MSIPNRLSIIIISLLGIIIYANSLLCSFHLDDIPYIINNQHIKDLGDLRNIWAFFPCRFLTFFSLALNYHLNHLQVEGFHLVNMAIHLGNAILVWGLVYLTLSTPVLKNENIARMKDVLSLLAGLVFVSHPVQTEAVTYIWQRAASLAALFYLASLTCYVQSRLNSQHRQVFYISSIVLAIAAMFTKENAITLPLIIVLYDYSFLGEGKPLNGKRLMPLLLTLLIIPVTMLLTSSIRFQEIQGVVEGPGGISPMDYLWTQFRVMVTYIRLVFLPVNLNLDYDYPLYKSLFEMPVLLSFSFLAVILYLAKRLFQKYRLVSFSIFWFFLTLLPESSLLPQKDLIFEHRLYLPMVGFSMFLVSSLYYLLGPGKRIMGVLACVIACYSLMTYQRNKVWFDEFTLWNDCVQKSPHQVRSHNNRGIAYYVKGDYAHAIADFNKAIKIDPNDAQGYYNRGILYGKEDKLALAIADFDKAIQINPQDARAYTNRGFTYYQEHQYPHALSDYNKAFKIDPQDAMTHHYRGLIYYQEGNFPLALADFDKAIETDAHYAMAFYNRGLVEYHQDHLVEALSDYNKAIEINPNYAQAYDNRAAIYFRQGQYTQALTNEDIALEIDPRFAEAYVDRGISYDHQGDLAAAIADYTKALEINPQLARAHKFLGLVYFKQGHNTQALGEYTQAISLDAQDADAYNDRGSLYGNEGDLRRALADFNKALSLNPHEVDAYNNRQTALKQMNGEK